jgi:hypothetical protein
VPGTADRRRASRIRQRDAVGGDGASGADGRKGRINWQNRTLGRW